MGTVSACRSVSIPADGRNIWPLLGEPGHHPSWLTLHRGFDGKPPARLGRGDRYRQQLALVGRQGSVAWMVTDIAENILVELTGAAPMRIRITLRVSIEPAADDSSAVTLGMRYEGALLRGAVAETLCRATETELANSLARLRQLISASTDGPVG
ncbi:SRPBCC family protein [Nocardia colli]|uniref:SRPBCC family protein n=1 Tax=Nocardia colli TaxID=2545717 RepID=UPI0035E3977F